jgi:hypothetical protein
MLGEFPGYTSHVRWLPCEDVLVLTEELDKRTFLFGGQISPHGGGLGSISSDKFHLLYVDCRLEGGRGGGNFLLECRHLRWVRGGVDLFGFLAKKHGFYKGGFSFLTLLGLPEAAKMMMALGPGIFN